MKRYIIKATYLSGKYKGDTYFMCKGGYITDLDAFHFAYNTYATESIAKMVCTKLYNNNELNVSIERNDEKYNISKGKPPKDWYIYEHELYEPYAIEC